MIALGADHGGFFVEKKQSKPIWSKKILHTMILEPTVKIL